MQKAPQGLISRSFFSTFRLFLTHENYTETDGRCCKIYAGTQVQEAGFSFKGNMVTLQRNSILALSPIFMSLLKSVRCNTLPLIILVLVTPQSYTFSISHRRFIQSFFFLLKYKCIGVLGDPCQKHQIAPLELFIEFMLGDGSCMGQVSHNVRVGRGILSLILKEPNTDFITGSINGP